MIKEVIVVEGRDDTRRLREVFGPEIQTIETNGSAINQETIQLIQKAAEVRGVIVFTDPDFAGQKIRQAIQVAVPTAKHAFIERKEAKGSKPHESLGVEHASKESIRRALEQVYDILEPNRQEQISQLTLRKMGLVGCSGSERLRDQVTSYLRIGRTNGKQLAKRLQLFGIDVSDLEKVVQKVREEKVDGAS